MWLCRRHVLPPSPRRGGGTAEGGGRGPQKRISTEVVRRHWTPPFPPKASRSRSLPGDEVGAGGAELPFELTNLGKVFWPEEGYTKGDLIAYYRAISPWLLPYLRNRPLVMTRYPDGIAGKSFFQKDDILSLNFM